VTKQTIPKEALDDQFQNKQNTKRNLGENIQSLKILTTLKQSKEKNTDTKIMAIPNNSTDITQTEIMGQ
jgi:hypothetical protein